MGTNRLLFEDNIERKKIARELADTILTSASIFSDSNNLLSEFDEKKNSPEDKSTPDTSIDIFDVKQSPHDKTDDIETHPHVDIPFILHSVLESIDKYSKENKE